MSEILVTPFRADDRARWGELWRGYLDFYETTLPESIYDHTWARVMEGNAIFGFGARLDSANAPLVGITHYLFHDHAWSPKQVCYLQDLFVDATVRGTGCGRALIERVAQVARQQDCLRLYWTTKENNATARVLYDRLAKFNGFIRYDYALG
ncbi:MAG: GNAT family N-acetyltransferase [Stellaceae bacterium]